MNILGTITAVNATLLGVSLGLAVGGGIALAAHGAMAMERRR